ncbi:DMT family transporter [Amphritea sp. HPY]|uniref:DMT family transporter n=1 Tax=Amphritea sp. HPY TaxID=3421652 RepID=UPI003D7CEA90
MLSPQLINWLLLSFLIVVWGTSFMSITVAIEGGLSPALITLSRIICGALVLTLVAYFKGLRLPLNLRAWGSFMLLGLFGNALPFFLISWGQQSVPSGTTGVLMSVMPLVTMILAHFLVPGEHLNRFKIAGFITAFTGVFILLNPSSEAVTSVWGALAILTAASSYALNTVLIRLLPAFNPIIAGAGMLICALLLSLPVALMPGIQESAEQLQQASQNAVYAVIWLGLIPTGVASIVYFTVVNRAGPSFLSNCNFLIPLVAFLTGAMILNEAITIQSVVALITILAGIGLTRKRSHAG